MIKNINDLLSFIVLIILVVNSQSLFIYAYFKTFKEKHPFDEETLINKWNLFKEYNDNVEE